MAYQTVQQQYDAAKAAIEQQFTGEALQAQLQGKSADEQYAIHNAFKRQYEDALKVLNRGGLGNNPYAANIDAAGLQIDKAAEMYNPYIKQGQEALTRYQSLYQTPLNYQYSANQGQRQQLGQVETDVRNQMALGNQQIDQNAAISGGLFGGNRLRQQGMLGTQLANQGNQMQTGLNQQFEQQGYQAAYGDRQNELTRLGGIVNQGQMASQGLSDTTGKLTGLMGQLYQGYGNETAQMMLAKQAAEDAAKSSQMGLLPTVGGLAGLALSGGNPAGYMIGTGVGTVAAGSR